MNGTEGIPVGPRIPVDMLSLLSLFAISFDLKL